MTGSLQIKCDKFYAVLNFVNQEGKRKQKWLPLNLPVKGNKRRAEAMLSELLVSYQGIEYIEPMNACVSNCVGEWIESNRTNVAKTTYDQYVNMHRNHVAPYFQQRGITLGNLTPGHLEDYYKFKVQGGLSPNTVIKHHAIIRSALQWAVKHRYVKENVADLADKPARVRYRGEPPYSAEEVAQLIRLTQGDPISVPIFLASFYGLRRSEILGLKWSSIDFQRQTITISTTVVREQNNGRMDVVVRENTTKTDYSLRVLPLCPYTYQYLTQLRQHQQSQQALCGSCYNPHYLDFVCVDGMGMLLQPDFVSQRFQQILNYHGLRRIRFHDLRHSCATIMLYLGYSMKDIQTWLGHSNYNFTADTYVHSAPEAHVEMAGAFSEKICGLMPSSSVGYR